MRLKRYQKWLIRVLLYGLLIILLLLAFLYFFPLTGSKMDRRVSLRLKRETGRDFVVHGARLFLARGTLWIDDIEIFSKASDEPPLHLTDVTVRLDPVALLRKDPAAIREISFSCLEPLQLAFDGAGFKPLGSSRILVEAISPGDTSLSNKGPLPLLRINLKEIVLKRIPQKVNTSPTVVTRLTNTAVTLISGVPGVYRVSLDGTLESEIRGRIRAQVIVPELHHKYSFHAALSHALISDATLPMAGSTLELRGVNLEGVCSVEHEGIFTSGSLTASLVSLNLQDHPKPFSETGLGMYFQGHLNPQADNFTLDKCRIDLEDSRIWISGLAGLNGDMPFALNLHQNPVSRRALDRLKNRLLPPGVHLEIQPDSLVFDLNMEGALKSSEPPDFHGILDFKEVVLRHEDFPLPVTGLEGRLEVDNTRIMFPKISGRMGDGFISINGRVRSDQRLDEPETVRIGWDTRFSAADLLLVARRLLPLRDVSLSGRVESSGEADLVFPSTEGFTRPSLGRLAGSIRVHETVLCHPALPGPISALEGSLELTGNEITFSGIRGRLESADFATSGSLSGTGLFWIQPELDGTASLGGGLPALCRLAAPTLPTTVTAYIPDGLFGLNMRYHIPLYDLSAIRLEGEVSLDGGFLQPPETLLLSPVEDLNVRVSFDPEHVLIHNVSCSLAGMDFRAAGELDDEKLRLKITGRPDIEMTRRVIPMLRDEVRGTGTLELSMECVLASSQLRAAILSGTIPPDLSPAITGMLRFRGASFAYKEMPSDLYDIQGIVTFDQKGLRWNDLNLRCASSPDCISKGSVDFSAFPVVRIMFFVASPDFTVDDWRGQWGRDSPSTAAPRPEERDPNIYTLDIDARIVADKIRFEGLHGRNAEIGITYRYYPFNHNRLTYEVVNCALYDGKADASGTFTFPEDESFIYTVTGSFENVDIQPLLTALRGRQENFSGTAEGRADLMGISGFPETITGSAEVNIRDSRILRNMILQRLGRSVNSRILDDITFPRITSSISFSDGAAHLENTHLISPVISLEASGKVDFSENLDILCYMAFSQGRLSSLPVVRQLAWVLKYMGRLFVKYRITGSLKDPVITTVPFHADEIARFFTRE